MFIAREIFRSERYSSCNLAARSARSAADCSLIWMIGLGLNTVSLFSRLQRLWAGIQFAKLLISKSAGKPSSAKTAARATSPINDSGIM